MFEGDVNSESKKFYSENNTPTSIYWKSNRLLVEEGSGFSVVGVEQLEN